MLEAIVVHQSQSVPTPGSDPVFVPAAGPRKNFQAHHSLEVEPAAASDTPASTARPTASRTGCRPRH